jgi:hypothetical protein
MTDKSVHTSDEAPELSPEKKPYVPPVLTKLGALRDLTMTINTSRGNRDGQRNRNTGRGGMNGLSQDSAS